MRLGKTPLLLLSCFLTNGLKGLGNTVSSLLPNVVSTPNCLRFYPWKILQSSGYLPDFLETAMEPAQGGFASDLEDTACW